MTKKTTKKALVASLLSLLLCFSMLIGTTFAWFTDSVTSSGNIIKSGTLDVELMFRDTPNPNDPWQDASQNPIFDYKYWEPGFTQVKYVKLANVGSLAFRWQMNIIPNINVADGEADLADVIDVYMLPADATITRETIADKTPVGTLSELIADADGAAYGVLLPEDGKGSDDVYLDPKDAAITATGSVEYAIVLKMQESAGNEYQGLSVGEGFSVQVLATQYTWENDSFNHLYDDNATYPTVGSGYKPVPDLENFPKKGIDVDILSGDVKIASMMFPTAALADGVDKVGGKVEVVDVYEGGNISIADGEDVIYLNIDVDCLKANNTEAVVVRYYMGEDKQYDPNTFKVYHRDEEIQCSYDPNDGYVTFESTNFSPFAIVYDPNSTYVPDDIHIPEGMPKATVVESPEYENVELDWGSYGQWSPTAGLDSQLEAAYTFSCTETFEEAKTNPYANWYCDFYVKLDKDLGENEIFLGGNYGSFGWVGFHNGDLTLEANTEIPLLGSVTSNPWTYVDVVQNVGTFICGVGDVDDALADATFTVMLRLTNPEDDTEFYDVATLTPTFTKIVNSGEELQDAVNNGNENIELGGDIDLSQGIVIPGN